MRALRAHLLDAYLNGASLRAANGRIRVTNIQQEITQKSSYGENTGLDGRRRHRTRRELIRVTVEFGLLEIYDATAREAAVEAANAWADDGILRISSKPGRQLRVQCRARAAIREPRNPKERFSIVFETAESPFWEDVSPAQLTLSGTEASQAFRIPGTTAMEGEVRITPGSGTLNSLQLSLGDSAFSFTGLNVAAGHTLIIDHDENGYLRIRADNVSRLSCRSAASDDELMAGPGQALASFTADTPCSVVFLARGRYR